MTDLMNEYDEYLDMYHCLDCNYYFDENALVIQKDGDGYHPKTNFAELCPNCLSINIEEMEK